MESAFESADLVSLWDRPPEFLPRHPPGGAYRWPYARVRQELFTISSTLGKEAGERRVALLAHPDLTDAMAAEGIHVGIQLLLAGESAAPHRHTPSALRVGLEASDIVTTVDDEDLPLGPLDVVLNPSGTWHGHHERGGGHALWLDVVDLPLVSAVGGVLFEPTTALAAGSLLDPPDGIPPTLRYPWVEVEASLDATPIIDGVRTHHYGDGSVLPTMAVTAHAVDDGATLSLPAQTAGAVALVGRGRFDLDAGPETSGALEPSDVIALRSWTPASFTAQGGPGVIIMVDTAPALRRLGLHRQGPAS